jgi:molybdopterin converting factor small subunit
MFTALSRTEAASVTVILPPALMRLFPGCEARVQVAAATLGEMLEGLDDRWPGMRDRLRDSTPQIRRHISVFVDGRRAALDTPLPAGATVYVLTMVSGG